MINSDYFTVLISAIVLYSHTAIVFLFIASHLNTLFVTDALKAIFHNTAKQLNSFK